MRKKATSATVEGAPLEDLVVDRVDGVGNPATGTPFLIMKQEDPEEATRRALTALAKEGLTTKVVAALVDVGTLLNLDKETIMKMQNMGSKKGGGGKVKMPNSGGLPKKMKKDEEELEASDDGDATAADPDEDEDEDEDEDIEEGDGLEAEADSDDPSTPAGDSSADNLDQRVEAAVAKALSNFLKSFTGGVSPVAAAASCDSGKGKGKKMGIKEAAPSRQVEAQDAPVKKSAAPEFGKGLFTNIVFGE